ncbi:MAG: PHP-associated domain-containing protein [archaeon]|jgi:histidinol phosphatase-like PHP family hydrolase
MNAEKKRTGAPILADMHTHLLEKRVSPKKWWKLVKARKLSVVAITEHGEKKPKKAYLKLLKARPKQMRNMLLIPGMEAKTNAGHVLVYGQDASIYEIKKLQEKNVPLKKVLEIAKCNNLTVSLSHPYGYKLDSACEIIGEKKVKQLLARNMIGIEYYNGMLGSANDFIFRTEWVRKLYNFFDFAEKNRVAKKLRIAKRSGRTKRKLEKISKETIERVQKPILLSRSAKFITVGSDAHYPKNIGSAVIELKKRPKDAAEFLKMIRNRETLLAGPNFYSQNPVDELKKKELFEGLKYVAESRVGRIKKSKLVRNVKKSRIAKKITKTKITGKIKKAVGKLRKKIRRK